MPAPNPDRFTPGHRDLDDSSLLALRLPRYFAYRGDLPLGDTWTLGPVILTRDSDTLEESNAAALLAALRARFPFGEGYDPEEGPDQPGMWEVTRCRHFGYGWIEHLSYKARTGPSETRDTYTPIHAFMEAWFAMLADYPVADEMDYSRREFEREEAANA